MNTVYRVLSPENRVFTILFIMSQLMSGCGEKPAFTESAAGIESADLDKVGKDTVDSGDVVANDGDNDGDGEVDSDGGNKCIANVCTDANGNTVVKRDDEEGLGNLLLADETTQVNTQSNVDILWVVDSSGSMSEEQNYLGQNFSSFIGQISQSGIDFQTGVTSTDICSSTTPSQVPMAERYCPTLDGSTTGHLRGTLRGNTGEKVLKPGMSNLASRFRTIANVGVNGSGYEHGLKAAEMAVAKSLAGQNEGLVRQDAFLAVIVVSDEEDDGIGLGITDSYSGRNYVNEGLTSVRYTDLDLVNYLTTAKGAGKFSVSAITGTRLANGSMCTSAHSQPREAGTQYIAAANRTGGIVQSICDTNWSDSLARMGQDIAGQSAQITLAHAAYSDSIKVFVGGVANFDWTYSASSNSIKFEAGKVPPNGSSVNVKYYYAP